MAGENAQSLNAEIQQEGDRKVESLLREGFMTPEVHEARRASAEALRTALRGLRDTVAQALTALNELKIKDPAKYEKAHAALSEKLGITLRDLRDNLAITSYSCVQLIGTARTEISRVTEIAKQPPPTKSYLVVTVEDVDAMIAMVNNNNIQGALIAMADACMAADGKAGETADDEAAAFPAGRAESVGGKLVQRAAAQASGPNSGGGPERKPVREESDGQGGKIRFY